MDGYKEFQGKSLDEAIRSACAYYDLSREKLEIDIVQDAKTGIFGLVGARKAIVRARRAQLDDAYQLIKRQSMKVETSPGLRSRAGKGAKTARAGQEVEPALPDEEAPGGEASGGEVNAPAAPAPDETTSATAPAPDDATEAAAACAPEEQAAEQVGQVGQAPERRAPRRPREAHEPAEGREPREARSPRRKRPAPEAAAPHEDTPDDLGVPCIPFEELDKDKLLGISQEVADKLVRAIVAPESLTVALGDGHVSVHIECGEDSGLLIGREGQTLAALQYMTSRIISRHMGTIVRVQFDAGEYRLRQDEKLRDMAIALAEKVRSTGRSYSTRPLSSYHRRIIHMVLQDVPDVQTRSSGDGPLKRVVVQRKKAPADK